MSSPRSRAPAPPGSTTAELRASGCSDLDRRDSGALGPVEEGSDQCHVLSPTQPPVTSIWVRSHPTDPAPTALRRGREVPLACLLPVRLLPSMQAGRGPGGQALTRSSDTPPPSLWARGESQALLRGTHLSGQGVRREEQGRGQE